MKKIILSLLILSLLCQSCFSYKPINIKNTALLEGKKYKIYDENTKLVHATLVSQNDTVAKFKIKEKEVEITKDKITYITVEKFSIIKTVIVLIPVLLFTLFAIALSNLRFNTGSMDINGN